MEKTSDNEILIGYFESECKCLQTCLEYKMNQSAYRAMQVRLECFQKLLDELRKKKDEQSRHKDKAEKKGNRVS